jgi:hypothetical protein
MTEQQYRVIADIVNEWQRAWPNLGAVEARMDLVSRLVRIEHPVPITGLPDPMRLTDAEADSFHEAMHAPHPPTREQIVQALGRYITEGQYERVLALIQNGADR